MVFVDWTSYYYIIYYIWAGKIDEKLHCDKQYGDDIIIL